MFRRTFLTAASAALAGCGLAPSGPTTDGYPRSPPNVLASFEWRPAESAYLVSFDRGNTLTEANTGSLTVRSEDGSTTVWVRGEVGDDDRTGAPVASFPLEPGATVTHGTDGPTEVRLIWASPEGDRSVLLDQHRPASTPRGDGT